jgi:hypothetical protein
VAILIGANMNEMAVPNHWAMHDLHIMSLFAVMTWQARETEVRAIWLARYEIGNLQRVRTGAQMIAL